MSPADAPCGQCVQCRHIEAGQHADVVTIRPNREGNKKGIGIGEVREIQHQASLKPYEGEHRVFIFDGAEHMSEDAANALLKTLEEPPPQVLLALLASNEEALLPTILSRCRRVELRPMPMKEIAKELMESHSLSNEEAEKLARLAMGCLGWAISAAGDPFNLGGPGLGVGADRRALHRTVGRPIAYASELGSTSYKNRDGAIEALNLWLQWWRDVLMIKEGLGDFVYNLDRTDTLRQLAEGVTKSQAAQQVKATLQTMAALEQNANPRLALEVLMLGVPANGSHSAVRERA